MSLLMIAIITNSVFPLAQTIGLHTLMCGFIFTFVFTVWSLGGMCRNTKQGLGEIIYVNELYFKEINVFKQLFPICYCNTFVVIIVVIIVKFCNGFL